MPNSDGRNAIVSHGKWVAVLKRRGAKCAEQRRAKPERGRSPSAARAKRRASRTFRQSPGLLAAADGDRPRSEKILAACEQVRGLQCRDRFADFLLCPPCPLCLCGNNVLSRLRGKGIEPQRHGGHRAAEPQPRATESWQDRIITGANHPVFMILSCHNSVCLPVLQKSSRLESKLDDCSTESECGLCVFLLVKVIPGMLASVLFRGGEGA